MVCAGLGWGQGLSVGNGSAVLIVAHGSRDPEAVAEISSQIQALAHGLPGTYVQGAVLEFPGTSIPSIKDGLTRCVQAGAHRVIVLPLFLFEAGHVREDIPGELARAAGQSTAHVSLLPPILPESALLEVISARAREALATLGDERAEGSAVLLVGAGTSDPAANAELFRAARLFWERREFPLVEVAFVSLTRPDVAEGVKRCVALGARRIAVVPYFLNSGVLIRRIAEAVQRSQAEVPASLALAAHFGTHPALISSLVARARGALAGDSAVGQRK